jgi:transposase
VYTGRSERQAPRYDSRTALAGHELNPVEAVWSHLRRSLANLTKHDLTERTALGEDPLERMQYRPGLLVGFLASTGLRLGRLL